MGAIGGSDFHVMTKLSLPRDAELHANPIRLARGQVTERSALEGFVLRIIQAIVKSVNDVDARCRLRSAIGQFDGEGQVAADDRLRLGCYLEVQDARGRCRPGPGIVRAGPGGAMVTGPGPGPGVAAGSGDGAGPGIAARTFVFAQWFDRSPPAPVTSTH